MPTPQPSRSAVLAPGGNNSIHIPLLMYARLAVERRGGSVRPVTWELAAGAGIDGQREMVASKVAASADEITTASGVAPLMIGKSLGSLSAPVAADRALAAIWFTPLLTDDLTAAALERSPGPCLLVGGTADPYWDRHVARSVTATIVEIDGADHAMLVPGPLSKSAGVLGEVMTAVEDFLDRTVWP
jgi:pimeloyl-ACP methyl ester carboxylesterase